MIPFKGKVVIREIKRILNVFFKVDEVDLAFEGFNGEMITPPFKTLCFERGDAVAALVRDTSTDTLLFVEQFRFPTYEKSGGWIIELPAGMFKLGEENPADAMMRELLEEAGYEAETVEHISTFYVSPGGTSERVWLYYMTISPASEKSAGGGLAHEGENIRRHMVSVTEAMKMMDCGVIQDAKTIIALQWLQMQMSKS